ncbi:hypothetical protein [Streptomyces sp. HSG2]|uniref:hypothetical protein n=1 Tax=Streptomyces sp. HSG2 TaxID=2797167 RepID=UPI0019037B1A|nr:hypothetical protein [Streptomyces sp. HSG2]
MSQITEPVEAPSMSATPDTQHPPSILRTLPLPDPDGIADAQRPGTSCVWCQAELTIATAVNLGERVTGGLRWWPRSCPACVPVKAHRALLDHPAGCAECAGGGRCGLLVGLYRVVRDGMR